MPASGRFAEPFLIMKEGKEVLVFPDIGRVSDFALKRWRTIIAKALNDRDHCTLALSGGKTPLDFYRKLSCRKETLPWEKIHIFLVDERFVPFSHSESNYGMIKENLFRNISIPEKNIHPIYVRETNPRSSAEAYEKDLKMFFALKEGEFPRFDLIMLGIGEDGHTASLFPESPWLAETNRLAVGGTIRKLERERISITLPVINNARNIIFLVSGRKKAPILKEVLEGDNSRLPAARVKPPRGKTLFLIDTEAGIYLVRNK